eukprot:jgi/Psemu1/314244/fgenesh1_kg.1468_\
MPGSLLRKVSMMGQSGFVLITALCHNTSNGTLLSLLFLLVGKRTLVGLVVMEFGWYVV